MSPSVSVSEKTLEHWSSQYLTYRYKSKVALWWPNAGKDIDVRALPVRPGKAVHLELKTLSMTKDGLGHYVKVDIGQLNEYLKSKVPVFYVFPWRPHWTGELETSAIANAIAPTEIAFSRVGNEWWFANWMIVMTCQQVADLLHHKIAKHPGTARKNQQRLVTFKPAASTQRMDATWANCKSPNCSEDHLAPEWFHWREFWTKLQECGDPSWPQVLRLPSDSVRGLDPFVSRNQMTEIIRTIQKPTGTNVYNSSELVTYISSDDGWVIGDEYDTEVKYETPVTEYGEDVHRAVTFLDLGLLNP